MDLHDDDTGRGVSLDTVLAELKRGKTFPCYLLCGDEEFRLRNALEKITQRLIPDAQDRELNLFVTDGEHEDVDSLCESLITPPLLPGLQLSRRRGLQGQRQGNALQLHHQPSPAPRLRRQAAFDRGGGTWVRGGPP